MVIDFHHHLVREDGYVDNLLRAMDRSGIDKTCLCALNKLFINHWDPEGPETTPGDNATVARAVLRHPDRLVGFGFIRLGVDAPSQVDRLCDKGFRGIKTTIPKKDYNDEEFYPVYERIQALKMPVLFHTGIVVVGNRPWPGENISSARMQPVMIEALGHAFPRLKMVMAHLGVPWHEEAALVARVQKNIFVDLSCGVEGWRFVKPAEWFKELFFWKNAHEKIIFGSDVYYKYVPKVLQDYKRILDGMRWSAAQQAAVFGNNAASLLHLENKEGETHGNL